TTRFLTPSSLLQSIDRPPSISSPSSPPLQSIQPAVFSSFLNRFNFNFVASYLFIQSTARRPTPASFGQRRRRRGARLPEPRGRSIVWEKLIPAALPTSSSLIIPRQGFRSIRSFESFNVRVTTRSLLRPLRFIILAGSPAPLLQSTSTPPVQAPASATCVSTSPPHRLTSVPSSDTTPTPTSPIHLSMPMRLG
ncbi:hypothetical protein LINPERPRIM_LOCUS12377, partial [Linum perenne]